MQDLGEDYTPQLIEELKQVAYMLPRLIKKQAEAAGKAMAALWLLRRHLWLSQSRLQQEDRACLMKLPVEPSAMFGQEASALLQRAQEARRCAREISRTFGRRRGGAGKDRQVGMVAGLGAMVPGSRSLPPDASKDPACLRITTARRILWTALSTDHWVVSTMTQGYRLQFARTSPYGEISDGFVSDGPAAHRGVTSGGFHPPSERWSQGGVARGSAG
ncbi:hypothetical protein NQZ68_012786 [Dissostichus eleginoides]|nr:hypothetical protein NQZ68_012786 [Dissostichus eleginoides]